MAQHIEVKTYFRPQDNTIQAMLSALPIQTQVISNRITMVADNPRTGIAHRIANIITPEAATLHWAMDQLKIDHLMVLGSRVDNTASWRYGHRSTGCCRVAYNALAVSEAAVHMGWQGQNDWQQRFGQAPSETEAVIYNMITALTQQQEQRLQRIAGRMEQRFDQQVTAITAAARKRAEHKVKAQMAARVAIIERFKHTGPSKDSITAVIKDPVYRFTAGIANSHLAQENTGQDK
jgi:hypothetical protein